jgi:hypothetical protein
MRGRRSRGAAPSAVAGMVAISDEFELALPRGVRRGRPGHIGSMPVLRIAAAASGATRARMKARAASGCGAFAWRPAAHTV